MLGAGTEIDSKAPSDTTEDFAATQYTLLNKVASREISCTDTRYLPRKAEPVEVVGTTINFRNDVCVSSEHPVWTLCLCPRTHRLSGERLFFHCGGLFIMRRHAVVLSAPRPALLTFNFSAFRASPPASSRAPTLSRLRVLLSIF